MRVAVYRGTAVRPKHVIFNPFMTSLNNTDLESMVTAAFVCSVSLQICCINIGSVISKTLY